MLRPDAGHREVMTALAVEFQPASYLEIGVREGDSLMAVLDGHQPRHLALCDTWGRDSGGTGRGNHDHITELLAGRQYAGTLDWLDGRSEDILHGMGGLFDLVHIDGDHSTETALYDLLHGWRLARLALVFHDMAFATVREAFHRFSAQTGVGLHRWFTGDTGTGVLLR